VLSRSNPIWGRHKAALYECEGNFSGVGLPYVYWSQPSESEVIEDPKAADRASFVPVGIHLIRCKTCLEFDTGCYSPKLSNSTIFAGPRLSLPTLQVWDWVWESVPKQIQNPLL
jgi:hypothetical protein